MNTHTVFIFTTWQAKPVYHDYGRIRIYNNGETADVTQCGLVMYDGKTRYRAVLREDHAELFASPCSKCFREAA